MSDTYANPYRSHTCGALRASDVGATVQLAGWVHAIRDHGKMLFVDLRDRHGMTQLTLDTEALPQASELRAEWVIGATGEVLARGQANPKLPTGEVEVAVSALEVLNQPKELPIEVAYDEADRPSEELRFRYRHLDMRRPEHARLLLLRHGIVKAIHRYLDEHAFVEVETPILNRATPEGARDFLVPSRLHQGSFYALPQSPQLMKQILMIAGLDRYYQIARCFRDEALRKDRQPEFTQLDLEMSFVTPEDIYALMEGLFAAIFRDVLGRELTTPFPRMSHAEALRRFGIDRPDLRFGLELIDLTETLTGCGFVVFETAIEAGGQVKAIRVPGGASYSRKVIEKELQPEVAEMGARGLAWMKAADGGFSGPVAGKLSDETKAALREATGLEDGDLLLFVADAPHVVADALGRLRGALARKEGLVDPARLEFVWIVDFPMFRRDEDTGQVTYEHHPFTNPEPADLDKLESEPLAVGSQGYDLVMNGFELGGGSIRIHRRDVQERVFSVLGIGPEEAAAKFGWFMDTLDHGAPPHGGIALGIDRIVMLLASAGGDEVGSIREVMAFPKTARGTCPLTEAPSAVDAAALDELGVAVTAEPKDAQ